ncbi:phosphatidylinositol-specific phospholipase C1-like protein [Altererythrobacter sp. C41]|uniref:phosphatidylinositol-specific phospholipase C1-like protein n=1 Tax=Altererythrobacter sp. C41 TaxID=2806021 RepID=UPI00193172D2|nr:phosphatidylinositol-specific phospholipase C1-like protein [Altererythrobacter sp. C41]MBM0170355.1 phosphatidylinositol-specific phospholipase C1-like protein [Altererythrobacter sp. C41]
MFWLSAILLMLDPLPVAAEEPVRINDLVMVGTHNSYKLAMPDERMARLREHDPQAADSLDYAHRPLTEQLDAGARQIELDVYYDPHGDHFAETSDDPALRRPGFKVQHIPGLDDRTSCPTLVQCLAVIKGWSDAHPGHAPILVMMNAKDSTGDATPIVEALPFTETAFDALDREIRSMLPADKLIVPDDVQGSYPTLREAVLADNWPTLDAARGRLMFALDEGPEKVALYRGDRVSLEGRVLFVNTDEDSPAAAYLTLNHPIRQAERIRRAVEAGFIVRTRADEGTAAARTGDTRQRDAALASGAQYVSTDYLWPDPRFGTAYRVGLPGGAAVACNPVSRPQGCGTDPLEAPAR